MREFSKVSPAVWQSERFHSLPSDDGRYVHLYLLTNDHQNSAGCYRLPDGLRLLGSALSDGAVPQGAGATNRGRP